MLACLPLRPCYVPLKRRWASRGVHSVRIAGHSTVLSYCREKLRSSIPLVPTCSTACHLLDSTLWRHVLQISVTFVLNCLFICNRWQQLIGPRRTWPTQPFCNLQNGAVTVLSWTHVNLMLLHFWNVSYKYLWKLFLTNSSTKQLNVHTLKLRPQPFLYPQY
jgi:hypothetical protein